MKRIVFALVVAVILSGCAGPKYSGSPIDRSTLSNKPEVVVIRDTSTRAGFLETVEEWLTRNDYKYVVISDNSKHEQNKLTLEYSGKWSWDLALYLSSAKVEAFHGGQRVGRVDYEAPNTLNGNKFSVASDRIKYMLDVLFGRITASEANGKINARN